MIWLFLVFASTLAFNNDRDLSSVESLDTQQLVELAHSQWDNYKRECNKQHDDAAEKEHLEAFVRNFVEIEKHNRKYRSGKSTYEMGLNHMADWTSAQYEKMTSFRVPTDDIFDNSTVYHVSKGIEFAPASYDISYMTPYVKNHGSCRADYAFAAMAALEGAHYVRTRQMLGSCQHTMGQKGSSVSGHTIISKGDENAIVEAVARNGPVSIKINTGTAFMSYSRGILDVPNCGNTPISASAVVGYGTENGIAYFRLKNSWGTGWGEQGYVRIRRGLNMCGIGDWASYPHAA